MSTNSRRLGKYELRERLGRGGMGEVWKAFDTQLQRYVAIKLLHTDLQYDPSFLTRFQHEAQVIASLHHPNIVQLYDFQLSQPPESESPLPYMVMDYVEGQTLANYIRTTSRVGKFPADADIVHLFTSIGAAVDYAHHKGMIHRDIKPSNVLLDQRSPSPNGLGEPVLTDFGIAKLVGSSTNTLTAWFGTPMYTSPEQAAGAPGNELSDLYSLGVILYEICTGVLPFRGDNASAILMQHLTAMPTSPALINPNIPPPLTMVILRSLAKDPAARFPSASSLVAAIAEAVNISLPGGMGRSSYPVDPISGPTILTPMLPSLVPGMSSSMSPVPPVMLPPTPLMTPSHGQQSAFPAGSSSVPFTQLVQNIPAASLTPGGVHSLPGQQDVGEKNLEERKPRRGQQWQKIGRGRAALLVGVVIMLLVAGLSSALFAFRTTHPPTLSTTGLGLGVTLVGKAPNQEPIGVSDGTFAFDTQRSGGILKREAAEKLKTGDVNGAVALWRQAIALDSNDAETLIYLEDQRVLASGSPYITIVAGTALTGANANVGRFNLQGAYVAQKEYNDSSTLPNGVLVRLLIANSGSQAGYATTVAQQIAQASHTDRTIVGVTGWPLSDHTINVIKVLNVSHIPLVAFAASDALTGISPYFFRVSAPTIRQAAVGAQYAEQVLHAKRAAVFVDSTNSFSSSLAKDFVKQFQADGNTIAATEHYTVGKPATVVIPLKDALSATPLPDMIYFAGYASDASTLLANLPTAGPLANLPVVGANALYELGGYQSSATAALFHLHVTALAYPDEWGVLAPRAQQPSFFRDYPNDFDPNKLHQGSPYGYTRASADVMLSYDAMLSVLQASTLAMTTGQHSITPGNLQQALRKISGKQALQGVSGQISFGADGNPTNKIVLVLCVDRQSRFHLAQADGQFLLGGAVETKTYLNASCN